MNESIDVYVFYNKCPVCKGDGEVEQRGGSHAWFESCSECGGTGKVIPSGPVLSIKQDPAVPKNRCDDGKPCCVQPRKYS